MKKEAELEQRRQPVSAPQVSVAVNSTVTTSFEVSLEELASEEDQPPPLVQTSGQSGEGVIKIQLRAVAGSLSRKLTNLVVQLRLCLRNTARRFFGWFGR